MQKCPKVSFVRNKNRLVLSSAEQTPLCKRSNMISPRGYLYAEEPYRKEHFYIVLLYSCHVHLFNIFQIIYSAFICRPLLGVQADPLLGKKIRRFRHRQGMQQQQHQNSKCDPSNTRTVYIARQAYFPTVQTDRQITDAAIKNGIYLQYDIIISQSNLLFCMLGLTSVEVMTAHPSVQHVFLQRMFA